MADIESEIEAEQRAGKALAERVMAVLKDPDGRNRVEDLVAAIASITGERCLEAAGDFNPRDHDFTPGARVLSEQANELLTGNQWERWDEFPPTSVCGILWAVLRTRGYELADFPSMKEIFEDLAAHPPSGKQEEWGHVPLSIPQDHLPRIHPIRINFESRGDVDRIFAEFGSDNDRRLRASAFALATVLVWVAEAIDHAVVLRLALELVNGMAKTAPMTPEALAKAGQNEP